MPVYHVLGNALVSDEELVLKQATGALGTFLEQAEKRPDAADLEFSTGGGTVRGITRDLEVARGERSPSRQWVSASRSRSKSATSTPGGSRWSAGFLLPRARV